MPLISSTYHPPSWLQGRKHAQTIIPGLFRRPIPWQNKKQERLETPDGDFLVLDWNLQPSKNTSSLLILCHGLEGDSVQPYIVGMGNFFHAQGWDCLAWNLRGCGGSSSDHITAYGFFSGLGGVDDLHHVMQHSCTKTYSKVVLIGFSFGGALTLRYLAEYSHNLPSTLSAACVFSVPCDIYASVCNLSTGVNRLYMNRLLSHAKKKLIGKRAKYPSIFSQENLDKIQGFTDYDNLITAPLQGFSDALEYYRLSSPKRTLHQINIPTLLLNAQNDPFLHPACFPFTECQSSKFVHLETPSEGGHVGFLHTRIDKPCWSEIRAKAFVDQMVFS